MTIRRYEPRDFEDVRYVCLNSEGPNEDPPETRHFILTTYCDYYLEQEPYNCFVLADDRDRAVGYIICAAEYDRFRRVFLEQYLPRIPESDPRHREYALSSADLQQKYKTEYPAHLHIDILPSFQRQGWGSRLADRLRQHLAETGVPGVMLTVGSSNTVGRSFYEKYGFVFLEENGGDAAYGICCRRDG